MKPTSTLIIPAQPGYYLVHGPDEESRVLVGHSVIAWKISTFQKVSGHATGAEFESVTAITVEGDAETYGDFLGVLRPDGRVEAFDGSIYESFRQLQEAYKPHQQEPSA